MAGVLLAGGAVVGAGLAAGGVGEGGQGGWHRMFQRGGHGMRAAMTPEEMDARIRERFARLDRNSDGFIDKAEVEAMIGERRGASMGGMGHMGRMGRGMGQGRSGEQAGAAASPAPSVPGAAPAPGQPGRGAGGMLGRFDENHDGKVTKDEFLNGIKRRFAALDLDNDGKITEADLPPMMRGRDILKQPAGGDGSARRGRMGHVVQWIRAADANHDGIVTLDEVLARAGTQFARLDRNGDGVVDQADRDIMRKEMADYGVLRFMHRYGADKDGKVSREQFTKIAKERMARMADAGGMKGPDGMRGGRGHGGMMEPGGMGRHHGGMDGDMGRGGRGPDARPPRAPDAAPPSDGQRRL
jgi:Ca2+-binding EF-hand superfamily protein